MDSTVTISVTVEEEIPVKQRNRFRCCIPVFIIIRWIKTVREDEDMRKVIHSIKVGIALLLVSLLYLLDPLYQQVGENAMWAIMTVVVVFEFFAGATLRKGINRGIGTVLGGGLGCLAAAFAQQLGGIGDVICVSSSVFIFGAAATYVRLVPSIKKKHDYGVMIFILTFNLVVVSGIRAEQVLELARERLSTIGMGFGVCIFISLLIFPTWASDDLHRSISLQFSHLAKSIEGCLEAYFKIAIGKENQAGTNIISSCKSVLNSKAKDETLANFAKWEPWHGNFGLHYPWEKYLRIGELLRDLAATILSFKGCLESPRQPSTSVREAMKERCEEVGTSIAWSLRELGESILKMRKSQAGSQIMPKLKSIRQEINLIISPSKLGEPLDNGEELAIASFLFLMMEMVEKLELIAEEVEQLGEIAEFHTPPNIA